MQLVLCLRALLLVLFLAGVVAAHAQPVTGLRFTAIQPSANGLSGIAFGQNQFVGVGAAGTILQSADGLSWTREPAATTVGLNNIMFADGQFVACGQSGIVLTSPDGTTWTVHKTGILRDFRAVTYGDGIYVIAGSGGTIVTSTNGADWMSQDSAAVSNALLSNAAFGNGRFFVWGGNTLVTSTNGVIWTKVTSMPTLPIAFGNGRFVAADESWSTDGLTWQKRSGTGGAFLPVGSTISFANGLFVSLGQQGIVLSRDGLAWTSASVPGATYLVNGATVAYGNGRFVAVSSLAMLTSTNAFEWSLNFQVGPRTWHGVTFAGDRFFALGSSYPGLWESTDARYWNPLVTEGETEFISTGQNLWMSYGNGVFVGQGSSPLLISADGEVWRQAGFSQLVSDAVFAQGQFVAVGSSGSIAVSSDGFSWVAAPSGTTNALSSVRFGRGQFVAVGDKGTILRSTDGLSWEQVQSGISDNLTSLAFGNGKFVAAVFSKALVLTSADGRNWTSVTGRTLSKIAFGNGLFVGVSGSGLIAASLDGESWTVNPTHLTDTVTSVIYGAGKFIITGSTSFLEADLAPGTLARPVLNAGSVTLQVTGEIGRVYRVQAASRLSPPNWSDIGSFTNNQLNTPFEDRSNSLAPQRFYRVVSGPNP